MRKMAKLTWLGIQDRKTCLVTEHWNKHVKCEGFKLEIPGIKNKIK